jgi:DNA-directed RNA polymerase subunit RPC12/RpoP
MGEGQKQGFRIAGVAGGVLAAGAAVFAGLVTAKHSLRAGRFLWRLVTFQRHTRCPDCGAKLWADARLCVRCGHRLEPAPRTRV